jgi:hypothetical protein
MRGCKRTPDQPAFAVKTPHFSGFLRPPLLETSYGGQGKMLARIHSTSFDAKLQRGEAIRKPD